MALKKNKYRVPVLKLRNEYEYITIQRASLGVTDSFGVRATSWVQRSTNTKANIQPRNLITGQGLPMFNQGLVEVTTHWALIEKGKTIEARDRIIDYGSNTYEVLEVNNWETHKEAILRILEPEGL